jgi:hypothetical protein
VYPGQDGQRPSTFLAPRHSPHPVPLASPARPPADARRCFVQLDCSLMEWNQRAYVTIDGYGYTDVR